MSEIQSATDGEVVDVRNDLPEAPVNQSISGKPTVKQPRDYAGNHVAARLAADRYACTHISRPAPPGSRSVTRSRKATSSACSAAAETRPLRICTSPYKTARLAHLRQPAVRRRRLPADRDREHRPGIAHDRPGIGPADEHVPAHVQRRRLRQLKATAAAQGPAVRRRLELGHGTCPPSGCPGWPRIWPSSRPTA
jgi:hypothetical protein